MLKWVSPFNTVTSPTPQQIYIADYFQLIQTEAERRRREAGVQQAMENGLRSCLYVCMYVCFFKDIARSRALSESKVVSCCSPVNSRYIA